MDMNELNPELRPVTPEAVPAADLTEPVPEPAPEPIPAPEPEMPAPAPAPAAEAPASEPIPASEPEAPAPEAAPAAEAPAPEPAPAPEAPKAAVYTTLSDAFGQGSSSGAYRYGPGNYIPGQSADARTYSFTRPAPAPRTDPAPARPAAPAPEARRPAYTAPQGAYAPGPVQSPYAAPRSGAGAYANTSTAYGWSAFRAQTYGRPEPGPVTETVRPGGTPPPAAPAAESAAPTGNRSPRRFAWWVPFSIVGALLLGLISGVLGYRFLVRQVRRESAGQSGGSVVSNPPVDQTPISELIQKGEHLELSVAPALVYRQNVDAVVGISNEGTTTNVWGQVTPSASSGTGFIISEDGYILTNYHVVKGADTLTVTLYDGTRFAARLVGYESTTCDVALLKIEASGLHPVTIGDSDKLAVGEPVCAIGNPLGELSYSLTVGYISAKERAINPDGNPISMLQTDAAINNGNSGGPLFDFSGNVVGIVTAKYSGTTTSGASLEGLGFAIPINAVMNMVDDLKLYGKATNRAYLGVRVTDASLIEGQNLPNGAYLTSVESGFCAERAGLRAGDVVIGMDNRTISSYADLLTGIQGHTAGQTVELRIWRNGERLTVSVTFDARPEGG